MLTRLAARQVTLQQDRGRYAIDGTLAFLAADVGGDEQVFRRFCRQPFIP